MYGLDCGNEQVWCCELDNIKDAKEVCDRMMKEQSHIYSVVAVSVVSKISKMSNNYIVSHNSQFLFMENRPMQSDQSDDE
jgi:hypothetical protein